MLYFCLYVQLRRGSVAGYTTDESWAYGKKESEEAFESITSFDKIHIRKKLGLSQDEDLKSFLLNKAML